MITLESQRFMVKRARSTIKEVKRSHVSMVHPNAVTKLLETAAGATT